MRLRLVGVLILVVLLLASCGQQTINPAIREDYRQGSQGLVMTFLQNAPPRKIYTGDPMDITVQLQNRGAWPPDDSFDGFLVIHGFDQSAINGYWEGGNLIPATLRGSSQFNPEGSFDTMTFTDADGVRVPFDGDSYQANLIVTACYAYKTIADIQVCVDPDPFAIVEKDRVCFVDQNGVVGIGKGTQGAPIAVSAVTEEIGAENIFFKIHVSNVGNGRVVELNALNFCPFQLETDEIDKVYFQASLPFDANPECSPRGTPDDPIRLVGGQGFAFCKFLKPNTDSAFLSTLQVILDYGYSDRITWQTEIVNLR